MTRTASRSACRTAASTFIYGDAFPHDADLDKLGGVDFKKGCYVGQEVVSRVEHRGTARNRVVPVASTAAAPPAGAPVTAGDKTVGTMGSSAGTIGLAMLRVDRVAEALAAGTSTERGRHSRCACAKASPTSSSKTQARPRG